MNLYLLKISSYPSIENYDEENKWPIYIEKSYVNEVIGYHHDALNKENSLLIYNTIKKKNKDIYDKN